MNQVYHITNAARMVGLHPHTLRDYERQGLITFRRDDCNARIFDQPTLKQIRQIALENLNRQNAVH